MLKPDSILGAYRIVRPLGRGGMGHVYEAEHVALKVRRAVKVFETESEHGAFLRKRFAAEGRILADLRHPRIVRVYDFAVDEASGAPYFAMDLVLAPSGEPRTLETVCREGADESLLADWFRDVCEGLAYIHSKGVVHRDISLDNILIGADGRAVLTDFGIAKIVGDDYRRRIDITKTMPLKDGSQLSWGKGLYLSPELCAGGEATPASDAYALGVLLFRILAGSWYTSDTRLDDALAGMDYNWSEVIARLCAKDPSARLGAEGIGGVAALLRKSGETTDPKRRWRVAIVAALALLGILAAGVLAWRPSAKRGPTDPPTPSPVQPAKPAATVYHVVDVTNVIPQTVYHVVDVTNYVPRGAESPAASSDRTR